MQQHIPYNLLSALTMSFTSGQPLPLRMVYNHYLVCIELFKYQVKEETIIDVTINRSSFLMSVILNGRSSFSDVKGKVLSESSSNSCTISHYSPGNYKITLYKGSHEVLLLTFWPDWFIRKGETLNGLKPLIDSFFSAENGHHVMPHCALAGAIFNSFRKLKPDQKTTHSRLDLALHTFVNECIDRYYKELVAGHFNTATINKRKAGEIEGFIKAHYAEGIVENLAALACRFNVSERNLLRLAKLAFDMPLHEYVVRLRMLMALKMLLTATEPIKEVAQRVGYHDPHYFSTAFKKFHKVPPSYVHGLCISHFSI